MRQQVMKFIRASSTGSSTLKCAPAPIKVGPDQFDPDRRRKRWEPPIAPPSSGRLSAEDWCPELHIVVPDLKMVFDFDEKLQRERESKERRISGFAGDIPISAKSRSLSGVDSFVSVTSTFLGLQLVETSSEEGESKRRSF
ncbi:hypothetical protein ACLB2K_066089 [Fragaria x ananassa]